MSSDIFPNFNEKAIAKILIIVVKAVGIDLDITFFKKFPRILSLLGSNASIKDGIPIVTTPIKLK